MRPGTLGIGMTSVRTRERLIDRLRQQGISNRQVLEAMREVPRHLFIDEAMAHHAYEDKALPIGFNQTISQPYTVARMLEALLAHGTPEQVLEVGTGSGYQTALLAELVPKVFTIERIRPLLLRARQRLRQLGYRNVLSDMSMAIRAGPAAANLAASSSRRHPPRSRRHCWPNWQQAAAW